MREKLLDLMKNEGLKPSQLAELLEINPAGISHILAGRNKPGFDLLQKILRRFPRINPDWLCSIPTRCIATANPNNPHRPLRSNRRSPTDCSVRPGIRRSTRPSGAGFDNVRKSGAAGNGSIFRHTDRRRRPANRNIVR